MKEHYIKAALIFKYLGYTVFYAILVVGIGTTLNMFNA